MNNHGYVFNIFRRLKAEIIGSSSSSSILFRFPSDMITMGVCVDRLRILRADALEAWIQHYIYLYIYTHVHASQIEIFNSPYSKCA